MFIYKQNLKKNILLGNKLLVWSGAQIFLSTESVLFITADMTYRKEEITSNSSTLIINVFEK